MTGPVERVDCRRRARRPQGALRACSVPPGSKSRPSRRPRSFSGARRGAGRVRDPVTSRCRGWTGWPLQDALARPRHRALPILFLTGRGDIPMSVPRHEGRGVRLSDEARRRRRSWSPRCGAPWSGVPSPPARASGCRGHPPAPLALPHAARARSPGRGSWKAGSNKQIAGDLGILGEDRQDPPRPRHGENGRRGSLAELVQFVGSRPYSAPQLRARPAGERFRTKVDRARSARLLASEHEPGAVQCFVAVVDDDEPARRALARLIRSLGFEAEVFASGEEFLAALPSRARIASCST